MASVYGEWKCRGIEDLEKPGIKAVKEGAAADFNFSKSGLCTSTLKKRWGKPKEDTFSFRVDDDGKITAFTSLRGKLHVIFYGEITDKDILVITYPKENAMMKTTAMYYKRA